MIPTLIPTPILTLMPSAIATISPTPTEIIPTLVATITSVPVTAAPVGQAGLGTLAWAVLILIGGALLGIFGFLMGQGGRKENQHEG